MISDLEKKLAAIGLADGVIKSAQKNKSLMERLKKVLELAKIESCPKPKGALLYKIASKVPTGFDHRLDLLVSYVVADKINTDLQLEAALAYIKTIGEAVVNAKEFEEMAGVGIVISEAEIKKAVTEFVEAQKAEILKERYTFNFGGLLFKIKEKLKWADGKKVMDQLDALKVQLLGPMTKEDEGMKKSKNKEEATKAKKSDAEEYKKERLSKIVARDLSSALNTKELLEKHKKNAGGPVVTRFPPEPNGILHIGHAKAMRHNFTLAEDYGGVCYLRFDDTNPEKENITFIRNIEMCVGWLGYKPWKTTFASDYFQQLYDYAVVLIKKGKAYVCHQTKEQIAECRPKSIESPWRNRPIEESLKLFEWMRQGRFKEKEAMLRLKIDMKHPNPCMRDPVAYRIKYVPHPHAGSKWCVYPMYDFTHCINDSLENITHSCCSLEFEIRRDLYYWILEALDIYRPYVWEFSRLNVSHTVLSKRLLQSLLDDKAILGWDDPRLMTLLGLKRRGVRPEAINEFCDLVGVTRRGNEMLISDKLFEFCIRQDLDPICPRTMTVIDPLLVVLKNKPDDYSKAFEANIFPKDPTKGKQTYNLTKKIYIERSDYQAEAPASFFGLTKKQMVLLKYGAWIRFESEMLNEKGELVGIEVSLIEEKQEKIPGVIHWVSTSHALRAEVRLFDKLFVDEDPKIRGKNWKEGVNIKSLTVADKAVIWNTLKDVKELDRFQFERKGYFAADYDTDAAKGRYVFNLIVTLTDGKEKGKSKKEIEKEKGKKE